MVSVANKALELHEFLVVGAQLRPLRGNLKTDRISNFVCSRRAGAGQ